MAVETSHIAVAVSDQVMHITLNRPEKKNAMTRQMYIAVAEHLKHAENSAEIAAVLVTGAGASFSVGNDLADFVDAPEDLSTSPAFAFLDAISTFPKPLLAAAQGHVIGVGMTFLLHCDLVLAAPSIRASVPFVQLGLCPEAASSYLLPALLGHQRAMASFLLGESMSATQLAEAGLVYKVVDDDALLGAAKALAARLASLPSQAVMATKKLLRSHAAPAVKAALAAEAKEFQRLMKSAEAQERFRAFQQRVRTA